MGRNVCVLLGSPRREGNTIRLVTPFAEELERAGHTCEPIWLNGREEPCPVTLPAPS